MKYDPPGGLYPVTAMDDLPGGRYPVTVKGQIWGSAMQDYEGKIVSEEEVATGLGFANVHEFRRWKTELGHKVAELEHELFKAKNEASNFQYTVKRMMHVLDKVEGSLLDLSKGSLEPARIAKLLLAISVVCGRGVDWNHELEDWLGDLRPKRD